MGTHANCCTQANIATSPLRQGRSVGHLHGEQTLRKRHRIEGPLCARHGARHFHMEFPLALTGPASHTVLFLPSLPRGTVTSLSNSRVDIHRYRLLPPSTAQSHCCGVHAVGSWDVSFLTGKEGLTGGAKTREERWKGQSLLLGGFIRECSWGQHLWTEKRPFRPREWSCSARVTASASPMGGSRAEMAHQSCPTNARPSYFHHICILAAGPRKEKEEGKASPIRA